MVLWPLISEFLAFVFASSRKSLLRCQRALSTDSWLLAPLPSFFRRFWIKCVSQAVSEKIQREER
jgi:hypothetical protein